MGNEMAEKRTWRNCTYCKGKGGTWVLNKGSKTFQRCSNCGGDGRVPGGK